MTFCSHYFKLTVHLFFLFTLNVVEEFNNKSLENICEGVAKEKEAAFFGITLHADKEILMLVVEKNIRDNILNALYKEMGMDKKAQGIVFSLPVSDVAGLAPLPETKA